MKFGRLEIVEELGRGARGERVRCRCVCGRTVLRYERDLRLSPALHACRRCRAKDRRVYAQAVSGHAFRAQWEEFGTLWMPEQTGALTDGIEADLEAAFGPRAVTLDSASPTVAEGYPWQAPVRARRRAAC